MFARFIPPCVAGRRRDYLTDYTHRCPGRIRDVPAKSGYLFLFDSTYKFKFLAAVHSQLYRIGLK
jgi:hypothetical protein